MQALNVRGICLKYSNILRNLCQNSYARVKTEAEGTLFLLEKGESKEKLSPQIIHLCAEKQFQETEMGVKMQKIETLED